jgi:hypothetical protein
MSGGLHAVQAVRARPSSYQNQSFMAAFGVTHRSFCASMINVRGGGVVQL